VEEVVGLEPTHVGFAIRGITSFAIPPTEMYSGLNHLKFKKVR
jgi:hypothetical protein